MERKMDTVILASATVVAGALVVALLIRSFTGE
jgi:hypothetical protein